MGLETQEIMMETNKELRDQRGIIVSAAQKNNEVRVDIERAANKVIMITLREMIFKLMLIGIIIALATGICIIVAIRVYVRFIAP